jgi:glycosyltransferase involved in cell wall biosynthesis
MDENLKPVVSVIITNYHHEAYLPYAVDSVLTQTFKDFELIIAYDDPQAKVDRFDRIDSRIRVVEAVERLGQAGRINSCLPLVSGDFVAFLDADDMFFSWKLTQQLKYNYDMSYGNCLIQYPNGRMTFNQTKEWDRELCLKKQTITAFSSIMVKTDLLRKCPFPENVGYGNDRVWTLDLSLLTDNIGRIPLPLFTYRDYTSQFTPKINFNPISKFNNLLSRIDRKKKQRKLQEFIDKRYG